MPVDADLDIVMGAIRAELGYLNESQRPMHGQHEASLSFAVANGYRAQFHRENLGKAYAVVESYYSDTRTPLDFAAAGQPRADVYAWWPNNERFIEIKWAWARTERKSYLKYYLWPALSDLGKLLKLVRPESGVHAGGKRVFALVVATDSTYESIVNALERQWSGLPDRETLELQLVNVYNETRYALLPGDVDPSDFTDFWAAMGYLRSVTRRLACNGQDRCKVEILEDSAAVPASQRHRYVVLACRF